MKNVLFDVQNDIINRYLPQGRVGVDYLVSIVQIDEEQLQNFELWKQHITCMAELRDVDKLCRYALTLSAAEFNEQYRFIDSTAAVEFALISLAESRALAESFYELRLETIFSSCSQDDK